MNINQAEVVGFLQPHATSMGQVSILRRFKVLQSDTIHLSIPSSTHCTAWENSPINADDVASSFPWFPSPLISQFVVMDGLIKIFKK
jgi:hypothetical protein